MACEPDLISQHIIIIIPSHTCTHACCSESTLNAERGTRSAERGTRSAERGARNAERGTRSAERGARNAERGTRSAERGARNAERGTRSAERGARNAERGTPNSRNVALLYGSLFWTKIGHLDSQCIWYRTVLFGALILDSRLKWTVDRLLWIVYFGSIYFESIIMDRVFWIDYHGSVYFKRPPRNRLCDRATTPRHDPIQNNRSKIHDP